MAVLAERLEVVGRSGVDEIIEFALLSLFELSKV